MYMPRLPARPSTLSCVLVRCSTSWSCGAYVLNAYVLPADSAISTEPSSETRRRPCDMACRRRDVGTGHVRVGRAPFLLHAGCTVASVL